MTGKRDGDRRGSAWKDLMVTRPNAGAAAIEETRDEIAGLRKAVEAQAAADAERPDPATRAELDAMESRLLERVAEAASGRAEPMTREEVEETVAGLADRIMAPTAPNLGPAAPAGGATEGAEAATENDERTVREQLRWIVHLLTWKRAPIRQDLEGIRQTANGIDAACAHAREAQDEDLGAVFGRLDAIQSGIDDIRGGRGIPFGWIVLGIVAGMVLEDRTGFASGLFRWLGS
ncbi:MAG: hypothetical protein F4Y03_14245 [Alphaproteobacteria bacterium]|nr:hypothetical protein [Alphaproteobacteria bacterium]